MIMYDSEAAVLEKQMKAAEKKDKMVKENRSDAKRFRAEEERRKKSERSASCSDEDDEVSSGDGRQPGAEMGDPEGSKPSDSANGTATVNITDEQKVQRIDKLEDCSLEELRERYKVSVLRNAELESEAATLSYELMLTKDILEDLQEEHEDLKRLSIRRQKEFSFQRSQVSTLSAECETLRYQAEVYSRLAAEHGIEPDLSRSTDSRHDRTNNLMEHMDEVDASPPLIIATKTAAGDGSEAKEEIRRTNEEEEEEKKLRKWEEEQRQREQRKEEEEKEKGEDEAEEARKRKEEEEAEEERKRKEEEEKEKREEEAVEERKRKEEVEAEEAWKKKEEEEARKKKEEEEARKKKEEEEARKKKEVEEQEKQRQQKQQKKKKKKKKKKGNAEKEEEHKAEKKELVEAPKKEEPKEQKEDKKEGDEEEMLEKKEEVKVVKEEEEEEQKKAESEEQEEQSGAAVDSGGRSDTSEEAQVAAISAGTPLCSSPRVPSVDNNGATAAVDNALVLAADGSSPEVTASSAGAAGVVDVELLRSPTASRSEEVDEGVVDDVEAAGEEQAEMTTCLDDEEIVDEMMDDPIAVVDFPDLSTDKDQHDVCTIHVSSALLERLAVGPEDEFETKLDQLLSDHETVMKELLSNSEKKDRERKTGAGLSKDAEHRLKRYSSRLEESRRRIEALEAKVVKAIEEINAMRRRREEEPEDEKTRSERKRLQKEVKETHHEVEEAKEENATLMKKFERFKKSIRIPWS